MKEIEEEAYKRIPLEILKHISDFCREHNITYSLHYGSLLGAVRHKGYIPWDDDIDIVMPRKDYEIFRHIYHSERYPLVDLLNDMHYSIGVAKVYDSQTFYYHNTFRRDIGLFIDVFVLDNIPDDQHIRKRWLGQIQLFKELNSWRNTRFQEIIDYQCSWKRKIRILLYKCMPISSSFIHKRLEKLMRKYESIDCEYVGCPIDIRGTCNTFLFRKELFQDYVELPFEKDKFMATAKHDEVLRILYGDYMQLPPENERVGKHGIKAYYK